MRSGLWLKSSSPWMSCRENLNLKVKNESPEWKDSAEFPGEGRGEERASNNYIVRFLLYKK